MDIVRGIILLTAHAESDLGSATSDLTSPPCNSNANSSLRATGLRQPDMKQLTYKTQVSTPDQ